MTPNMEVDLIDWRTGTLIETATFYDSSLRWENGVIHHTYGGRPTAQWRAENPHG